MFFFPLSLIVSGVAAWYWPLWRALLLGSLLFTIAVAVAWRVQGFEPTPRDLAWLALAWVVALVSSRIKSRRSV